MIYSSDLQCESGRPRPPGVLVESWVVNVSPNIYEHVHFCCLLESPSGLRQNAFILLAILAATCIGWSMILSITKEVVQCCTWSHGCTEIIDDIHDLKSARGIFQMANRHGHLSGGRESICLSSSRDCCKVGELWSIFRAEIGVDG